MSYVYKITVAIAFLSVQSLSAQFCTGTPASNTTVASSTNICPATNVTLSLLNTYTSTGLAYQWVFSNNSQFGPWTIINGANNPTYTGTLSSSGYYSAVIICTAALASNTATGVYINIGSSNSTTTVPYYEDFQSLTASGLPNCSWSATNLGTNSSTIQAGFNQSAAFNYSATALGTNTFFSMGVQLTAGVIYSVATFYKLQTANSNNWSAIGVGVGPNQSSAGSTVVATDVFPTITTFKLLSNTFTVGSSGIYYVQIFGTSVNGNSVSQKIIFDDLALTIPCIGSNVPSTAVSPTSAVICSNDSVQFVFSPAPNTTLSIPSNTMYYSPSPSPVSNVPTVLMGNTLSGCSAIFTIAVNVNPSPNVFMVSTQPSICRGNSSVLTPYGGNNTFTLNPGNQTGTIFPVSPTVTTTYTVSYTNAQGCTSSGTNIVTVLPSPTVVAVPGSETVCAGEPLTITGTGAMSYFVGPNVYTSLINLAPSSTNQTITITGKGANGCTGATTFELFVDACTGLTEYSEALQAEVYPNPSNGKFYVSCDDAVSFKVFDLTGRMLFETTADAITTEIELSGQKGIYLLQIERVNRVETVRLLVE